MTIEEIIKELRYCAEHEGCDYYIAKDCPREYTWVCGADCDKILMRAAADALEKLQSDYEYCSDILNIAIRETGISMTALVKLYEIECADGERRSDD
jgi:hypothetical protein